MFYLYALLSMLGYALQNVLLAHYARKVDGLSLAFYRNLSFSVTLLPLLLGSSRAEIAAVAAHWQLLLLGGLSGGLYLGLFYASYRHLPVGIAGAISRALMTVLLVAIGWAVLGDVLSPAALALLALIIIGSVLLAAKGNVHAHLGNRAGFGILLAVASALPLTLTNVTPAALSRIANPLVAGYFWEISIAAGAGFLLILRRVFLRKPMGRISGRTFLGIAAAASPTLVGTGFFMLATHAGPVAIVTAVGSASLVVTSLLGMRLYREHLRWVQWAAILLVLAGVAGLKFA
ncbi:MAG: DMT family transporter [Candidatus Peribacteraceae bacterium]|jgi:DME family drug/metabolite transporter